MVAAAVIGGSVIGAGASMVGAGKASKAATRAQEMANEVMLEMYERTRSDMMPYMDLGKWATPMFKEALPGLIEPIQMDEATLRTTPGYQFTLDQGLKGIQQNAAARGLGVSGAALKGAAGFATGLADSTYQTRFGEEMANKEFAYNALMGPIQIGENAAAQTGQFGSAVGSGMGANIMQAGNMRAAAAMKQAGAVGDAANNISSMYMLNALLKNNGGPGIFGA